MDAPILVVEDDEGTRKVLVDALTHGGFQAIGARDGLEGLQTARVLHPSVILLDLDMPVLDGVSFKRHQARDPDISSIPVICMSAMDNAAQIARDLGISECMTKPVDFERLLELVLSHAATDHSKHWR
jgi:two-component system cell cycle response regulator DivK